MKTENQNPPRRSQRNPVAEIVTAVGTLMTTGAVAFGTSALVGLSISTVQSSRTVKSLEAAGSIVGQDNRNNGVGTPTPVANSKPVSLTSGTENNLNLTGALIDRLWKDERGIHINVTRTERTSLGGVYAGFKKEGENTRTWVLVGLQGATFNTKDKGTIALAFSGSGKPTPESQIPLYGETPTP